VIELAAASLRKTGALRLRVSGSSMLPAILPGDVLSIRQVSAAQAAAGDVVLFRREDRFFVHRVLRREAGGLVTRGDALAAADPPVADSELLGKVVAIERRGRPVGPAATAGRRLASWVFARSPLAGRLFTRWSARGGLA
jgi:signal peptidase I